MKVLLLITNLRGGGAEKAMINIAAGLSERGHNVDLLLMEKVIEHLVPETINLRTVSAAPTSFGWFGKRRLAAGLRRILEAGGAKPFDLAISTLPFTDEVTQIAAIPGVWHRIANTLSAEIGALARSAPLKAKRRRSRYRRLYEGARVIANSKGVAADLIDELGIRPLELVTIYNPFDFAAIRKAASAPEPKLPQEDYVLHVGRFAPAKRHDLLLDAFAAADLPHRLVLLTPPSAELHALIASRQLESRVTIAGFQTNPYPWFARASAFVLSSDREGMPNALVEALVCGTPAVSTDCPSGPREVLTGPLQRWLVPPGDARALASRLREIVAVRPKIGDDVLRPFAKEAVLDAIEALGRRG